MDQLALFVNGANGDANPTPSFAPLGSGSVSLAVSDPPIKTAIDAFATLLATGTPITNKLATDVLAKAYGVPYSAGVWTVQDAYNALEGAVVKRVIGGASSFDDAEAMLALLPTQSHRTLVRDALQQFSTPPTIAALVDHLACVSIKDVVFEPSAGTGILAAYAKARGAKVIVNEIDTARLSIAATLLTPLAASNHDGRYINALYAGKAPNCVVMNPPFSADLHSISNDTGAGIAHVEAALGLLPPGGRLVAVLGSNQHPDAKPDLWHKILRTASLRYAAVLDGRAFYRMGTSFGTCVIVIDNAPGLPCEFRSTDELTVREAFNAAPTIPRLEAQPLEDRVALVRKAARKTQSTKATTYVPAFQDIVTVSYQPRPTTERREDARFAEYMTNIQIDGAALHPAPLVESLALSSVRPPMPVVDVRLPSAALSYLSEEQVEAIIYAENAFRQKIVLLERQTATDEMLEVEYTKGIMFGYGTGFGKGALSMGAVVAHMVAGNSKSLLFSKSQDLFKDSLEYWTAVAGEDQRGALFNASTISVGNEIVAPHGILFSTYGTLRTESRQVARSRVDQYVEWALREAKNERGRGILIIFDEAHELQGATQLEGERGKTNASLQGMAALELQKRLPEAKVIYMSATSASRLEAFSYAPRLGLWGRDTAFKTRSEFTSKLSKGGTGALEVLCRDTKALGVFLAASLSYDGVTYERIEHELTDEQIADYNVIARTWRIIDQKVNELVDEQGLFGAAKSGARSAIASTRQRSLQSTLLSMAMPTVIEIMREAMDDYAIVTQMANTYEASQERALAQMESEDDLEMLDLSPKDMMVQYLMKSFPVAQYVTVKDGDKERCEVLKDADGNAVLNPAAVTERDALIEAVKAVSCPDSPLQILLDTFGYDKWSEVTGRKRRVIRKLADGEYRRVIEVRPSNANNADTDRFMDGATNLLLFSESAGGTGRSFHASVKRKNKKRRFHLVLQTGWRSDTAVQAIGRTHRSAQECPPRVGLVTTNAPGQKRFTSTICRRMEDLGAASRGQRDAAGNGLFNASDNLEGPYGQMAVNNVLLDISSGSGPLSEAEWLEQTGVPLTDDQGKVIADMKVSKFLNTVLACDLGPNGTGVQDKLMDAMVERMLELIEAAKERGTYDSGMQELRADRIHKVEETVIHTDPGSGATTSIMKLAMEVQAHKTPFSTVLANVRKSRDRYGKQFATFGTLDGELVGVYRIANLTFEGRKTEPQFAIVQPGFRRIVIGDMPRVQAVDEAPAKATWQLEYDTIDSTATKTAYLVTGTLLPIYDKLPERLAKIYRVVLSNGERTIGRLLEFADAHRLLEAVGQGLSTSELLSEVRAGKTAIFENGYTLKRVKHNFEERLELVVPHYEAAAKAAILQQHGLVYERVNYAHRFFLPEINLESVLEAATGTTALRQVA